MEIDRVALEGATLTVGHAIVMYQARSEDVWRSDTGVGNPAGRTMLRVMLENAIGQALMQVRSQGDAGLLVGERLRTILESFSDLDVSLGSGWDRDYVSELS